MLKRDLLRESGNDLLTLALVVFSIQVEQAGHVEFVNVMSMVKLCHGIGFGHVLHLIMMMAERMSGKSGLMRTVAVHV